ncbi:hypothetical protein D3C87_1641600 [compost metagenome]
MIRLRVPVVPVQPVGATRGAVDDLFMVFIWKIIVIHFIDDQEQIQVTVIVIIKKRGIRRVRCIRDAILLRHFLKNRHFVLAQPLVYIQQVLALLRHLTHGRAHVNVQQFVIVNVHQSYAGRPFIFRCDTSLFGHILEFKIPLV